jgi:hypothetical protein
MVETQLALLLQLLRKVEDRIRRKEADLARRGARDPDENVERANAQLAALKDMAEGLADRLLHELSRRAPRERTEGGDHVA